jgi:hypothetical protein
MYSLGTWFVSGIYVLIPCIKEIMMMIIIIIRRRIMSRPHGPFRSQYCNPEVLKGK